ncbi:MAG TPA: cytochrome c [Xanthobacteraceae bacterium]|nr:cytochrome c [Xanthobacteraceae bacterium]
MPAGLLTSHAARDAGGAMFAAHCALCHGANGDGRGPRRAAMDPAPADLTLPPWSDPASAGKLYLAIRDGVPGTAMPSWPTLSDDQIWNVVAYVHALNSP